MHAEQHYHTSVQSCPLCGAEGNPIFILGSRQLRAIADGPLTKPRCVDILIAANSEAMKHQPILNKNNTSPDWHDYIEDALTPEELSHVLHVQHTLPGHVGFYEAFDFLLCFGQHVD